MRIVIIGGGIAGASAAYFLSQEHDVTLLEREAQPGYHSTCRSAAVYTENYASDYVSGLARASRPFLVDPPTGFAQNRILSPLGKLTIAEFGEEVELEIIWFAGQGGAGIKTSPALGALVATLVNGSTAPEVYAQEHLDKNVMSPGRLRQPRAGDVGNIP